MNKELEALERIRGKLSVYYNVDKIFEWSMVDDDFDDIEKSLKALEIINKKGLVNLYVCEPMLTQEEIELLNEVLL